MGDESHESYPKFRMMSQGKWVGKLGFIMLIVTSSPYPVKLVGVQSVSIKTGFHNSPIHRLNLYQKFQSE